MRRKYVIRPVFLAMVICGFLFTAAGDGQAQWPEQTKLIPSDGTTSDYFGYSVCIDGDYAIVGAHGDDFAGCAYTFERTGVSWNQVKKLLPSDGLSGDNFGYSVSISGDYAIVGAYGRDDNGSYSGAAYIFERIGGNWSQVDKLTASDGAASDYFGRSVSISGDYAIVGAYGDDSAGAAYIFERIGDNWSQVKKLLPSDGISGDNFGYSVSISGDYAIVGAYGRDDNGSYSGAAYIFERIGGNWSQVDKLTASDGAASDYFGRSVYISGDYAIVGADGDDFAGSAYIFERIGGNWSQAAKLLPSDGISGDTFGYSVSINGDYAIVGAHNRDDNGSSSGAIYRFEKPAGGWVSATETEKLLPSDGAGSDYFGYSVSVSGEHCLAGAHGDESYTGSAYVFGIPDPIVVTPAEDFLSSGDQGGPFEPNNKTYSLTNIGDTALDWTAEVPCSWVTIDPNGGTLLPGESNSVNVDIYINEQADTLPRGLHTCEVTFTNTDTGYPQFRSVELCVGPKKILAYTQYVDQMAPEYVNVLAALDNIVGKCYTLDELTSYADLDLMLAGHDVFLIPEPNTSVAQATLEVIGTFWKDTLQDFANNGGIVVHCDGSGKYGILAGAELMNISPGGYCSNYSVNVVAPNDLVAEGVSSSYIAQSNSRYYTTSEETVVVERTGYGAVVIHKQFGLGNVILIGHDYYMTNDDQNLILCNAVFNIDNMVVEPAEGFSSVGDEEGPFTPWQKSYIVVNNGSEEINWEASITCDTPENWLTVDPNGGILSPGGIEPNVVVSLTDDANALWPGTYSCNVVFRNLDSGNEQVRKVILEVNDVKGEIEVTDSIPEPNDLQIPFGGVIVGLSRTEQVTIANIDPCDRHELIVEEIYLSPVIPEFTLALPSGGPPWTVESEDSIFVDINFVPSDLTDYESALVIKSDDIDEGIIEVQLSGTGILDYLQIVPDANSEFSGHVGGPFFPWNASYQLYNEGPDNIDWAAAPNVPWLDVNPTGGTLGPYESILVTVMPNAQAENLLEGYYCSDVNFTNITTTVTQKRGVCLDVFAESKIWTSPQYFDVTLAYDETETKTLTIGNSGSSPFSFALSSRQTSFTPPLDQKPASAVAHFEISDEEMVVEYEFNEPVFSKSAEYDMVRIEGLELYERTGAPIVPVHPVMVLVPFGKKVVASRVIALDTHQLSDIYYLAPTQKPYPLSYQGTVERTEPDPAIYDQPTPWPGINHEEVGTQSKRGYQVFTVNLFPLQYVPTTGRISYTTQMRLEIDLVDSGRSNVLRPSGKTRAALRRMVDNPNTLETYPAKNRSVQKLEGAESLLSGGPYQYVIITNGTLESAPGPWNFQALCDAKIAKGVTATIVTTEWIYANYDGTRPEGGSDNQTRIRNFLIDAYQTWGTEYVLLGGTNSIVPARKLWVYIDSSTYDYIPCDMYYGCVDPEECTFNYDADGYYGEPTDGVGGGDVDLYAEIYVGRAPVANAAELANFVRKTLTYDSTELNDPYLPRIAMLGEYLGSWFVPPYAKDLMGEIRLGADSFGYFTYGFENHPQPHFIDFNTMGCLPGNPSCCWPLYDKDSTWPKSDLLCLMNGGVHIFNHLGHANYTYCMKLYTSDLTSLTNTDYFFVYSQGCDPGGFDTSNCFAEVITSMEHGAFAVVMNARSGWGTIDQTEGDSQQFNRQFWNAVLSEGMLEMGRANQASKEDNQWDINDPYTRWCYYELNLFGDPEQRFRLTESNGPPDPNAPWLELEPNAGIIPPGGVNDINVIFDANQPPGTYEGYIIISYDPCKPVINIAVKMTVEPSDYLTELFEADYFEPNDPNCNDMANRSLIFVPDGSSNYYSACSSEATYFPVDPNGGTIVSLGDDDYEPVTLQYPDVNFYGTNYDTFFISSNGYITFVSPDISYAESLVNHFALPRISPLFDDLNPSAGGTISWKQLSDRIAVTFENVPEYSLSNTNSFQIELFFNGAVRITWLNIDSQDGLVGLSEGMELPADFVESDLSGYRFSCDLDGDCDVDFSDYAVFGSYFAEDCNTQNNWCQQADFDRDGDVYLQDLSEFARHWLGGIE